MGDGFWAETQYSVSIALLLSALGPKCRFPQSWRALSGSSFSRKGWAGHSLWFVFLHMFFEEYFRVLNPNLATRFS